MEMKMQQRFVRKLFVDSVDVLTWKVGALILREKA